MGIYKQAADDAEALLIAFKTNNPGAGRSQRRRYAALVAERIGEWLRQVDMQDNNTAADFALSKAAQFKAFTDALPDPVLTPVDPQA